MKQTAKCHTPCSLLVYVNVGAVEISCIIHSIMPTYRQPSPLTQVFAVEHIEDAARGPHHYVRSLRLELLDLTTDVGPTDAGVAGCLHVVPQGQDHLLDLMGRQEEGVDIGCDYWKSYIDLKIGE